MDGGCETVRGFRNFFRVLRGEGCGDYAVNYLKLSDFPFESEPTLTSADAYREVTNCNAGHQECSTKDGSQGMHITFTSAKEANKAEPTLALKPRGDVTRNPKQGDQWPPKKGHMCPPKNFKKI